MKTTRPIFEFEPLVAISHLLNTNSSLFYTRHWTTKFLQPVSVQNICLRPCLLSCGNVENSRYANFTVNALHMLHMAMTMHFSPTIHRTNKRRLLQLDPTYYSCTTTAFHFDMFSNVSHFQPNACSPRIWPRSLFNNTCKYLYYSPFLYFVARTNLECTWWPYNNCIGLWSTLSLVIYDLLIFQVHYSIYEPGLLNFLCHTYNTRFGSLMTQIPCMTWSFRSWWKGVKS